jgi:hypothetical protein
MATLEQKRSTPPPELEPMARLFDHAYLTLDAAAWQRSPQRASVALLQRAFRIAPSFRRSSPQAWAALAANPAVNVEQYRLLDAIATIEPTAADAIAIGWHVHHRWHRFPSALIDPRHRMGCWP